MEGGLREGERRREGSAELRIAAGHPTKMVNKFPFAWT
jgi:hypothetical protein